MYSEITKEAFIKLVGNDEETWRDYKQFPDSEKSYYFNNGVNLVTVTNWISNVTQYYIQDINA